ERTEKPKLTKILNQKNQSYNQSDSKILVFQRPARPGKIMKVLVGVGDAVNEDDEVLKIESMKMENRIYAPATGTITAIGVKENDEVEVDDVLLVIEEAS
ncbi:MAG: hypothetical protein QG555_604, partial [Thermodesulfobacteriota bacterium]|nr:hypothetical protein [Thermodesulfobacteriota bacterium]